MIIITSWFNDRLDAQGSFASTPPKPMTMA